jgi:hypothetical protein
MLGVLEQNAVHVRTSILKQLIVAVEDDNDDLALAEHAQLVSFLHEAELALGERHLTISLVIYLVYGDFFPSHSRLSLRWCYFTSSQQKYSFLVS